METRVVVWQEFLRHKSSARTQGDVVDQRQNLPKRRARGKQRIDLLLAAAEQLLAEVGYERVTTNMIAARAHSSPGTLYQFFDSKQTIAVAIARRYAEQIEEAQRKSMDPSLYATAEDAIEASVDSFLKFLRNAPAYGALFDVAGISPEVTELRAILLDSATKRIAELIGKYAPLMSLRDQLFHSEVCVMLFRGMIPMIQAAHSRLRSRPAREIKVVIKRYLLPILHGGR